MKKPPDSLAKSGTEPRPPAFKNSELGPIPADWEVRAVGELACVCTGNANTQDKVDTGKYPFYVRSPIIEHINEYGFDTEGVVTVGDGLGTGKVFHYVNGKFALHQRCYLIDRFSPLLDSKYFYKIFSSRFYDRVMQMTAKSSVDSVRREMITGMLIPVPPLPDQRRIAAALSDADAWIESLDKLIEKKKLVKQGAMQDLLSGKTRLPGFSGKWVERRLGDCMVVNPPNDRQLPEKFFYVDLESVTKGRLSEVAEIAKANAPSRAQRLFQKDDILFQTVRPYQNNNLFVDFDADRFVASTGYAILRAKSGTDARLVFEIIQTPQFTNQVLDNCTGTGYPAINPGKLSEISFPFPLSLAEQRAIAEVLSDMDAELAALSSEKAKAEQIKQGMMQELLTGRVRLGGGDGICHREQHS